MILGLHLLLLLTLMYPQDSETTSSTPLSFCAGAAGAAGAEPDKHLPSPLGVHYWGFRPPNFIETEYVGDLLWKSTSLSSTPEGCQQAALPLHY